jgi:phosphatidylglycerophosphatase A
MTPKEKAGFIFNKMKKHTECKCNSWDNDNAKDSALIVVDEILSLDNLEAMPKSQIIKGIKPNSNFLEYWFEVKKEIINLS